MEQTDELEATLFSQSIGPVKNNPLLGAGREEPLRKRNTKVHYGEKPGAFCLKWWIMEK